MVGWRGIGVSITLLKIPMCIGSRRFEFRAIDQTNHAEIGFEAPSIVSKVV